MMRDDWKPLVHAACVAADDRFAIAFGQFEYDDPFFILIDYDGRAAQPWARRDVKREISSIISSDLLSVPPAKYAALSREGDVYFVSDVTSYERISGAGLASSDSLDFGEVFDMALIGDNIWVVGSRGQFYCRKNATWERIAARQLHEMELGKVDFGHVTGIHQDDIYLAYSNPADEALIPDDERERLLKADSWDEWADAYKRAEARRVRKAATRGLLHWNGEQMTELSLPLSSQRTMDALYSDSCGRAYLAGDEGVVAAGNISEGFLLLNPQFRQERVLSITKFQNKIYVSTNHQVIMIQQGIANLVGLPFVNAHPFKLAASKNYLFYFDRQAKIGLFDGKKWTQITVPSALLEREFHSL